MTINYYDEVEKTPRGLNTRAVTGNRTVIVTAVLRQHRNLYRDRRLDFPIFEDFSTVRCACDLQKITNQINLELTVGAELLLLDLQNRFQSQL